MASIKNGYPNVSPKDLGVETEDDAYLATKQAVYWIIKHGNEPNAKLKIYILILELGRQKLIIKI